MNPVSEETLFPEKSLTGLVIDAAYAAFRELGNGFLERVYENSLYLELRERGISCAQQKALAVAYRGQVVGEYFADLLVEEKVVVELKAATSWDSSLSFSFSTISKRVATVSAWSSILETRTSNTNE